MNEQVDRFLAAGCGRCPRYQTPQCKVHAWHDTLVALRGIILQTGLREEVKWCQPCYTHGGKNVLMLVALNSWCGVGFFKGALLRDHAHILERQGAHQNAGRVVKFTDADSAREMGPTLQGYIVQAIELEKAGAKAPKPARSEPMPPQLRQRLAADEALRAAWGRLTPGRKRGYLLHIGAAKQAKTRIARIDRCAEKIQRGKGLNER